MLKAKLLAVAGGRKPQRRKQIEQVIKKNFIQAKIYKNQSKSKRKICGKGNKNMNLLLSECTKLVQESTNVDVIMSVKV